MRPAQMHGGHDGRVGTAINRWRRGDNPRHFGHRCRQHRHMGRSHHRKFTPRNITAHRLYGDIAMTEDDARLGFDFDIGHAGALGLGEAADLILSEFYIIHIAG